MKVPPRHWNRSHEQSLPQRRLGGNRRNRLVRQLKCSNAALSGKLLDVAGDREHAVVGFFR